MPEQHDGATIYSHEVGALPPLLPHEHLAAVTGMAMIARGEDATPNVARVCIETLARLAGVSLEPLEGVTASPGNLVGIDPSQPRAAVAVHNLDTGVTTMHDAPKPGPHLSPVPKEN